jgi:hypothetical protein
MSTYVVSTYVDGSSGYRVWSDGYCEQWGYSAATNVTVTLFKPYINTDYNILFGKGYLNTTNTRFPNVYTNNTTTSSFYVSGTYNNGTGSDSYFWWKTCGYIS